jgi:uncharacterized protein YbcI
MSSDEAGPHSAALATISSGLVQLHERYYGGGPTNAKTYAIDDAVIVTRFSGGLTTMEKTLIDDGQGSAADGIRSSCQSAVDEDFKSVVERATGRKVAAYMSAVHRHPEVGVELFVLEPAA